MFKFIKTFFWCFLLFFFIITPTASAQDELNDVSVFKAEVVEVLVQTEEVVEDGSIFIRQKLKLKGLEKEWKDEEIIYDNSDYDLLSASSYKVGNKVLVNYSPSTEGEDNFYIIDHVRQGSLYWLIIIFALVVVLVGRLKGVRALVVLFLTFLIILKFIVPQILAGSNPLFITILGSLFILLLAIYITEGLNKGSTISIISILIALIITGLLSVLFTEMTKLNGFASDDVMFLIGLTGSTINIKGLFLAGVVIGSLGVLDDIVIAQVSLVKELRTANLKLKDSEIYKKSMKVGIAHLSSMVNTLFLAYAGVALPLFIIFTLRSSEIVGQGQILNNEIIATEIVRTLVGSIGLVLAVPISTFLATKFLKKKK